MAQSRALKSAGSSSASTMDSDDRTGVPGPGTADMSCVSLNNPSDMNHFLEMKETIISSTAPLTDKTDAVIKCWQMLSQSYVSNTVDKFPDVFEQLYAATIQIILKGEWFEAIKMNNYKNGDELKKGLSSPLNRIIEEAIEKFPRQCKLCVNLIPFLDKNPWLLDYIDGIVLSKDLPNPPVVEKLWEQENKHMLELRLECLCTMKMYSQAFNFALVCYLEIKKLREDQSQTGESAKNIFCDSNFSDEVTNLFYLLLCRLKSNAAIEKYLDVAEAVEVVSRLSGDSVSCKIAPKWKEWKKSCKTIINVTAESVLTKVVEQIDVNLVKMVYFHWIKHAGQEDEEIRRAKELLDRIDKIDTNHLYAFADVIVENFETRLDSMQKALELYIRAMTYDINQIEKLDVTTNQSEKKISFKNTLAQRYLHLSTLFPQNEQISWELTLTAFSLSPSQELFNKLFSQRDGSMEESLPGPCSEAEEKRTTSSRSHINLESSVIFTTALSEDLQTVIQNPRWKSLCWAKDRLELENLCRQQLDTGGPKIKAKEDLTHLNINYDEYKPRQSLKDYELDYGFEKGYEPKNLGILYPRKRGRHKKSILLKKLAPRKAYPSYPTAFNKRGRKKFGIARPTLPQNKMLKKSDSADASLKHGFNGKQLSSAGGLTSSTDHLQRYKRRKKKFSQVRDATLSLELNSFLLILPLPCPQSNVNRRGDRSAEKMRLDGTLDDKENISETKSAPKVPKFIRYTTTHCSSAAEIGELNVSCVNSPDFNGFNIHDLESLEESEATSSEPSFPQSAFTPSPAVHSVQHSLGKTDLLSKLDTDSYLTPIKFRSSSASSTRPIDLDPVIVLENVIPNDLIEDSAKSNALDVFIKILQVSLKYLQQGCHNPSISPTLTAAIEQSKLNNKKENPDSVSESHNVSSAIIPQIISEVCKHDIESGKFSQPLLQVPTCPINYFRVLSETSKVPPIIKKPGPKRITRKRYTQQMVQHASKNLKNNIKFKGQALGLEFVDGHLVRANRLAANSPELSQNPIGALQTGSNGSPLPSTPLQNCASTSSSIHSSLPHEDSSISPVNLIRLDKYIVLQSIANIQFDHPQPSTATEVPQISSGQDIPSISTSLVGTDSNGVMVDPQLSNSLEVQHTSGNHAQLPINNTQCLSIASTGPSVNSNEEIPGLSSKVLLVPESTLESTEIVKYHVPEAVSSSSVTNEAANSIRNNANEENVLLPTVQETVLKIAEFIYGDFYRSYYNRSPSVTGGEIENEANVCSKPLLNNSSTQRSRAGPRSKTKIKQPEQVAPPVDMLQIEADDNDMDFNPVVDDVDDDKDVDYIPDPPVLKKSKRKNLLPRKSNPDQLPRGSGTNGDPNGAGKRKRGRKKVVKESATPLQNTVKDLQVFVPPPVVIVQPKHIEIDNDALENHSSYKEGSLYLDHSTGYFASIESMGSDLVFECMEDVSAEDINFWELWLDNDKLPGQAEENWESLCGDENSTTIESLSKSISESVSSDAVSRSKSTSISKDRDGCESTGDQLGQPELTKPRLTDKQLLRFFQCKPCKVKISRVPQPTTNSCENASKLSISGKDTPKDLCSSDLEMDRSVGNPDTLLARKSKRISSKLSRNSGSTDLEVRSDPCKVKRRKRHHESSDDEYAVSQKRSKRSKSQKTVQKGYEKKSSKLSKREACPKSKKRCSFNDDTGESSSPNSVDIICLTDSEHEPDTEVERKTEIGTKVLETVETTEDLGSVETAVSEIENRNSASSISFESSVIKDESGVETNSEFVKVSGQEIEKNGWKKYDFPLDKSNDDIIDLSSGDEIEEDPLSVVDPLYIAPIVGPEVGFSDSHSSINQDENDKANEFLLSLDRVVEDISLDLSNHATGRILSGVADPVDEITSIVECSQLSINSTCKPVNAQGREKIKRIHQKNPWKFVDDQSQGNIPCSFLNEKMVSPNSHVFGNTSHQKTDFAERLTDLNIGNIAGDDMGLRSVEFGVSTEAEGENNTVPVRSPVHGVTVSHITSTLGNIDDTADVQKEDSLPQMQIDDLSGYIGDNSDEIEEHHVLVEENKDDDLKDVDLNSISGAEDQNATSGKNVSNNSDEIEEQHIILKERNRDDLADTDCISGAENQNVTSDKNEVNSDNSYKQNRNASSDISVETLIEADNSSEELDDKRNAITTCEINFRQTQNENSNHNHSPIADTQVNSPLNSVEHNEITGIGAEILSPDRIPSCRIPEDPPNDNIELEKINDHAGGEVEVINETQGPDVGTENNSEGENLIFSVIDTDIIAGYRQNNIAKPEHVICTSTVGNSWDDELEAEEDPDAEVFNIIELLDSPPDDENGSEISDQEETVSESGRSTVFSPDASEHTDRLKITSESTSNTSRSPSPQEDLKVETDKQKKEYILCNWNLHSTLEQDQLDDQTERFVQSHTSSTNSSEETVAQVQENENSLNQKTDDSICSSVQDKIQINEVIQNSIRTNEFEYFDQFPNGFGESKKGQILSRTVNNFDGHMQPIPTCRIEDDEEVNSVKFSLEPNNFEGSQSFSNSKDDSENCNNEVKIVSTFSSASSVDEVQVAASDTNNIEEVQGEASFSMLNHPKSRNGEDNCSKSIPRDDFDGYNNVTVTVGSSPNPTNHEDVQSYTSTEIETTNLVVNSIKCSSYADNQLCPNTSNEIVVDTKESSTGDTCVSPTISSWHEDGIAISSRRNELNNCDEETPLMPTSPNNSSSTLRSCPIPGRGDQVEVSEEYYDMAASSSKPKHLQDVQTCVSPVHKGWEYTHNSSMVVASIDCRNHEDLQSSPITRDEIENQTVSKGSKSVVEFLHSDCKRDSQSISIGVDGIEGDTNKTIEVIPSTELGNHLTVQACHDSSDIDVEATQVGVCPEHSVKIPTKRKRRRKVQTTTKRRRTDRERNIKLPSTHVEEARDSVDHINDNEVIGEENEEATQFPTSIVCIKTEQDTPLGEEINENHSLHFQDGTTSPAFHEDDDADIESVCFPCSLPNTDDVETDVDEDLKFVSDRWPDNSKRPLNVVSDKVDQSALHLDGTPLCYKPVEYIKKIEILDHDMVEGDKTPVDSGPDKDLLAKRLKKPRKRRSITAPIKVYNTRKRRPSPLHKSTKATEKLQPSRVRARPVLKAEDKAEENDNFYKLASSTEIQGSSSADLSQKSFQMPILLPAPIPSITPESASAIGQPCMPSLFPAPSLISKPVFLVAPIRGQYPDQGQVLGVLKGTKDEVKPIRKRRVNTYQPKPVKTRKRSSNSCRNADRLPILSEPDEHFETSLETENCGSPDPPVLQPQIY